MVSGEVDRRVGGRLGKDGRIAKVAPDGSISVIRRDPDGDGGNGALNQPGEPIIWKGRLVVSNFDAVIGPDKVNSKKADLPCTLTVLK